MLPTSRLYAAVRQFSVSAPVWDADRVLYHTMPDERWDITLVSKRVYGTRDEYIAVMAAAGLDRIDQELTERQLVLPSRAKLEALKKAVGYAKPVVKVR